jgi:phosphatidylinositol kinase/protein kinase (PI-3  family)
MQLLRDNQDSLMSVLEAFVHDPLVEWEDEKRKRVRGFSIITTCFDLSQSFRNANYGYKRRNH